MKATKGKRIPWTARVVKVSDHVVFDHSNLNTLSPKQKLPRLPIAHAQIKVGNTSENLLNEVKHIMYSLDRAKEVTKKCTII